MGDNPKKISKSLDHDDFLKEPLVQKKSGLRSSPGFDRQKRQANGEYKVTKPKRSVSWKEKFESVLRQRTEQHHAKVLEADFARWRTIVLTAMMSAALSFAIDEFTFAFGLWREKFTKSQFNYELYGIMLVNCGAVVLARLINRTTPESEGSGFPEMKAMLFGKVMLNILNMRVLVMKAMSLSLGVGAGLPLGKEGPNVHMAACISRTLAPHYYEAPGVAATRSESEAGEGERSMKHTKVAYMLLGASAVGVGSSFSAPIGGVLFALELMLPQVYDSVAYWGCFVSSVSGSLVYILLRNATAGSETLEPLISSNLENGEGATSARPIARLSVDILLGAICGVLGASWVIIQARIKKEMNAWRLKKPTSSADVLQRRGSLGIAQAGGVAEAPASCWANFSKWQWKDLFQVILVTAANTWLAGHLPLLGGKPQPQLMSDLFDKNLHNNTEEWVLPFFGPLATMFCCFLTKFFMTAISLSLPISAGVVAPVMIIGATVGRLYGLLMPHALVDYLLTTPENDVITDDMRGALMARFSIVGAAAFATGVSRVFSMAITIFEVLTLPSSLVPLCSSCLTAVFVANKISLPYFDMNLLARGLGGIPALTFSDRAVQPAELFMRRLETDADCLDEYSTVNQIKDLLSGTDEQIVKHFAIMQNVECRWVEGGVGTMLRGSIKRKALQDLVDQSRGDAKIHFLSPDLTMMKGSEVPPVCLNPPCVPPDALMKDVYISMKVQEEDAVFVVDGNHLVGMIAYQELLGHDLNP